MIEPPSKIRSMFAKYSRTTAIVLALAGVLALSVWLMRPAPTPSVTPGTSVAQPLPPAVSAAPSLEIPETKTPTRPPIRAIPKTPAVRAKVKLPPAIFDQADTYLMATGALAAEERTYTLSSILDRRTGETTVHARAEPLPLFSLSTDHGAAGLHYGLKNGDPVWRGSLSQEVFRIKQLRADATATLDSDGEWFAGVGAKIKW